MCDSADTQVIGLKCTDTDGGKAGIMAWSDTGIHTGLAGWRCTNQFHPGWHTPNYDASGWPQAHVVGASSDATWGKIPNTPSGIPFIYTDTSVTLDPVVYCRLGEYVLQAR